MAIGQTSVSKILEIGFPGRESRYMPYCRMVVSDDWHDLINSWGVNLILSGVSDYCRESGGLWSCLKCWDAWW